MSQISHETTAQETGERRSLAERARSVVRKAAFVGMLVTGAFVGSETLQVAGYDGPLADNVGVDRAEATESAIAYEDVSDLVDGERVDVMLATGMLLASAGVFLVTEKS